MRAISVKSVEISRLIKSSRLSKARKTCLAAITAHFRCRKCNLNIRFVTSSPQTRGTTNSIFVITELIHEKRRNQLVRNSLKFFTLSFEQISLNDWSWNILNISRQMIVNMMCFIVPIEIPILYHKCLLKNVNFLCLFLSNRFIFSL